MHDVPHPISVKQALTNIDLLAGEERRSFAEQLRIIFNEPLNLDHEELIARHKDRLRLLVN